MIGLVDPDRDEFYIGYKPVMPARLARRVAAAVACIVAAAAVAAIISVLTQQTLPVSHFEFGVVREFTGVLHRSPYPFLETSAGRLWLVAPGKFGAERAIAAVTDGPVRISGSLIERDGHRMAEIAAIENISELPRAVNGSVRGERQVRRGMVTLRGEIVDSKCHLGVMNPGEGAVHRDCARRCLSGGIPPMLVVRDGRGREALIVLVSESGRAVGRELSAIAGGPVEVTGWLARDGEDHMLTADASAYRTIRVR